MNDALTPSPLLIGHYQWLFERHKRGSESVGWPHRGKMLERYAALTRSYIGHTCNVLDYGCGLGGLAEWLHSTQGRSEANYFGVDVVPEFIASNQEAFKDRARTGKNGYKQTCAGDFGLITSAADVTKDYDHIVCCGVFNYIAGSDEKLHKAHIAATIAHLLDRTKKMLHVDFMSPDVDWKDPALHYQSIHDLVNLLKPFGHRYVIDRSYLPYEFCVHIWKNTQIDTGDNTYAA